MTRKNNHQPERQMMKKILHSILLTVALLALSVAPLTVGTGCSSVEKTTYRTVGTAYISVDKAMMSWGAYVARFHPPASQEAAVKQAYERYQASSLAVINTAQAYAANKEANKPAFDAALAAASTALSELVGVIQAFGVQIQ